jgi:DNA-binding transcriptional LysR family regulator
MKRSQAGSRLDWGDIRFFLAVTENGSIAGAARQLAVNHSTVLRRIAHLESELACRLFDRLPGGYALSAAGLMLAQHLHGLSEQMDAAERRLFGLDATIRGPLRVSADDVVVEGLLMPVLAQLRQRHAQVRIHLLLEDTLASLSRRDTDVAVRAVDQAPEPLIARRVGNLETVLCAARRHLHALGGAQALDRYRWVLGDESPAFEKIDAWVRQHVPPERVVARIDNVVGVADAVAGGLGVGLLPRPLAARRPELVELRPPEPTLHRPVWVMMHPDLQTARTRALFEFVVDSLAGDARLGH